MGLLTANKFWPLNTASDEVIYKGNFLEVDIKSNKTETLQLSRNTSTSIYHSKYVDRINNLGLSVERSEMSWYSVRNRFFMTMIESSSLKIYKDVNSGNLLLVKWKCQKNERLSVNCV